MKVQTISQSISFFSISEGLIISFIKFNTYSKLPTGRLQSSKFITKKSQEPIQNSKLFCTFFFKLFVLLSSTLLRPSETVLNCWKSFCIFNVQRFFRHTFPKHFFQTPICCRQIHTVF